MRSGRIARAVALALLAASAVNAEPEAPDWTRALPLPERSEPTRLEAATQGEIVFDSRTPFDFDVLLQHLERVPVSSTKGFLFLPAKASEAEPAPAMVVLPGSGGVKLGHQMLYADLLVQHGYAALVIDYYESRGIDDDVVPYPVMVTNVTEFDVVTDAYAALRALAAHPAIDPERIGLMGFSYGGMATRLALDARLRAKLAPDVPAFAAHVDFYGPCFQDFGTTKTTGAPLLTLRGARDASNDLVACARDEERLRAAGSEVGSVIFPTAGHSWGSLWPRHTTPSTYVRGCVMAYDERGVASVRGKRMIADDAPIDRASRFALRTASGAFFEGCLEAGYTVGRDEEVHRAANAELVRFIDEKVRR